MFSSEVVMVLSAAILNFCLNSLWFLLVKRCHDNCSDEEKRNPTPFLISFIGSLWASYGMFLMIKHISPKSMVEVISIAVGVWVCILMGLSAKHYAFSKSSLRCFVKDYLVDLFGLIIISIIISKAI